jgi:hypothetical protein
VVACGTLGGISFHLAGVLKPNPGADILQDIVECRDDLTPAALNAVFAEGICRQSSGCRGGAEDNFD